MWKLAILLICLINSSFQLFDGITPLFPEKSFRYENPPNKFKCFSIQQKDLLPLSSYDIKISFLGSVTL